MKLKVTQCYGLAWKSFSKWWIPLCLISCIIFAVRIVPMMLMRVDSGEWRITMRECMDAIAENDQAGLDEVSLKARAQAATLIRELSRLGMFTFPLIAFFTVVLLMYANWAVKNRLEKRRPFFNLVYIALVHVILAIAKLLAFFLFFFPGAYLYVKLLFVSLVMLESEKGAGAAIRISWRMTRGNFRQLFLLVLMNAGVQLLSLPTVIGIIPATGFANTARAAAFRMLWEEYNSGI